jgi:hypothetical protein
MARVREAARCLSKLDVQLTAKAAAMLTNAVIRVVFSARTA